MADRSKLKQIAVCALTTGAVTFLANPAMAGSSQGAKPVKCFGVNGCKGQNGCKVSKSQVKLANKVYDNKYAKAKAMSCAGQAGCSHKAGHLAWVKKPSKKECFGEGGFIFGKKNGKLAIQDKGGIKK